MREDLIGGGEIALGYGVLRGYGDEVFVVDALPVAEGPAVAE